ncbi:hypothetical protein N7523_005615 [Penicillium sp. IBT 18751x]|nr:hypothetical protein N7523_005615 [Penicillium sp. IBT 18751x]
MCCRRKPLELDPAKSLLIPVPKQANRYGRFLGAVTSRHPGDEASRGPWNQPDAPLRRLASAGADTGQGDNASPPDHVSVYIYEAPESEQNTWFENLLGNANIIAGFLVLASYPLIFQDFSKTVIKHFSIGTVRAFAALSVVLFVAVILICQYLKTMQIRQKREIKDWVLVLIVLEMLAAALMFFFLTIAASDWTIGLTFVAIDGLCAVMILVGWLHDVVYGTSECNETKPAGKSKLDKGSCQGASAV